jgi:methionine-rich copper-binding protein CopC
VAAAVAAVLLFAALADPPTRLAGTTPADGAVLTAPPAQVAVDLTSAAEPREIHLAVAPAAGGEPVDAGPPRMTGSRLAAPVSIAGPGAYVVAFHLVLPDGSTIAGASRFTVTAAGPTPADPAAEALAERAFADRPAGHQHAGGDPVSLGLLAVDLALLAVVATIPARWLWARRRRRT